ncbi:MAG: proton-conducting transporter membrane subunit [Opitutaceae bacterium]|nr:proton-conducting transporter membrane subunit [Opitutaceae bacterium]
MALSQLFSLLVPLLVALASIAVTPARLAAARVAAWLSLGLAGAAASFAWLQPTQAAFLLLDWRLLEVGVRADAVSLTLLVLVSFVGAQTLRFSERYLEGDARHAAFVRRMGLTLAAVQGLALSPSVAQLLMAGMAVSWGLHGLLLHFPGRPGAREAAWTKFVVSRIGDLCLGVAVVWIFASLGTTELNAVFAAVADGSLPAGKIAVLISIGALCKSAQLPFHTWLPETLETPTPVSAFMHAGVVNAGGFLVIRLHPLFEAGVAASSLLAIIGALTAAFGAFVMLTQTTIKRALAYSTVGQMGFMILQCGVGAYSLALLHIVAHAVYKSNAFLKSGSHVFSPPRSAVVLPYGSLVVGTLFGALLALTLPWTFPAVLTHPESLVFVFVLLGACAYSIARFHAAGGFSLSAARGYALAVGTFILAALLHSLVAQVVPASTRSLPLAVTIFVATLFVGLIAFQFSLARIHLNPSMRHLYVHASHGFYLGPWVNRQLRRFLPLPAAS